RGVAQGRHRDDRAASQQQKQATLARSATAKPLYATLARGALLCLDSMAAPHPRPLGILRPKLSASYSSLASLSSSGDFEIGSNHYKFIHVACEHNCDPNRYVISDVHDGTPCSNETPRIHHAVRRRGGVAARGASAASWQGATNWRADGHYGGRS